MSPCLLVVTVSFLLPGLRQITSAHPFHSIPNGEVTFPSPLCSAGCHPGLCPALPISVWCFTGHVDITGCLTLLDSCLLSWTVVFSPVPSVQSFETILLCTEPRPSMGASSYECLVKYSQRVVCLFCFGVRKPTQGLIQTKPALCCWATLPVQLLLFPL